MEELFQIMSRLIKLNQKLYLEAKAFPLRLIMKIFKHTAKMKEQCGDRTQHSGAAFAGRPPPRRPAAWPATAPLEVSHRVVQLTALRVSVTRAPRSSFLEELCTYDGTQRS